jgi:hypothetical protein
VTVIDHLPLASYLLDCPIMPTFVLFGVNPISHQRKSLPLALVRNHDLMLNLFGRIIPKRHNQVRRGNFDFNLYDLLASGTNFIN